jgi:hypothetical protein
VFIYSFFHLGCVCFSNGFWFHGYLIGFFSIGWAD